MDISVYLFNKKENQA